MSVVVRNDVAFQVVPPSVVKKRVASIGEVVASLAVTEIFRSPCVSKLTKCEVTVGGAESWMNCSISGNRNFPVVAL